MKNIPYGRQQINDDDIQAVVNVLKSDFLTQGPVIREFEEAFADYIGVEHAIAVANGTAALHLCALALGVESGKKVITTPVTFAASANCVAYCHGEVVFADICPDSYLIDLRKVEQLLASSPKGTYAGIIPVDFAGRPVNLEQLRDIADKYDCWIIEDACHAPGGFFLDRAGKRRFCGNGQLAEASVFSFHPVKHIAAGEGGMVTTNDHRLAERIRKLRTHGIENRTEKMQDSHGPWYYEMQDLGFNYRLTDIQAALACSQLKRADQGLQRRQEIVHSYLKAFAEKDFLIRTAEFHEGHAYHLFVQEFKDRNGLMAHLRKHGIFPQVHYIPLHLMPYYQDKGWRKGDFTCAEAYYNHCLSLPLYPSLTDQELQFVINCVLNYYQR